MRRCGKCRRIKPLDKFHRGSHHGHKTTCKPCALRLAAAWRRRHPEYSRARKARDPGYFRRAKLRKRYDLTEGQYDQLEKKQGSACAICRQPERRKLHGIVAPLVVDHAHGQGRTVRGLLCHACNIALWVLERPGWVALATAYLERESAA